MAYARRNNLVSQGHSPCESESVHDQCYVDGTERWTSEYSCYILWSLDHFRMNCGHALVVDWTPRYSYVLKVKVFSRVYRRVAFVLGVVVVPWWASTPDTWSGFEILISCKTCFLFSPPWNYYMFLRQIPYHSLWLHPRIHPLVNSREPQNFAAANIPQRFRHCTFSKLKYMECTKYVCVQAWTRACEQSVYVVCVPGWFMK